MNNFLFERLTTKFPQRTEELSEIISHFIPEKISPKEAFGKKLPQDFLAIVSSGLLRIICHDKKNGPITVCFLQTNDFVSSFNIVDPHNTYIYTIDAIEESELLLINFDVAKSLFQKHSWFERFCRQEQSMICHEQLQQLLISRLLHTESRFMLFKEQYPNLLTRVPLNIIASYLGILPQGLSRLKNSNK